jgi:hypothetical protein
MESEMPEEDGPEEDDHSSTSSLGEGSLRAGKEPDAGDDETTGLGSTPASVEKLVLAAAGGLLSWRISSDDAKLFVSGFATSFCETLPGLPGLFVEESSRGQRTKAEVDRQNTVAAARSTLPPKEMPGREEGTLAT